MTAEVYLQTIDVVFQNHHLPRGIMTHRGTPVDPAAITDVSIFAIEGERDDISGLGQTKAGLDLAVNLAEDRKRYFMVPGVGHNEADGASGPRHRRSVPAVSAGAVPAAAAELPIFAKLFPLRDRGPKAARIAGRPVADSTPDRPLPPLGRIGVRSGSRDVPPVPSGDRPDHPRRVSLSQ